MFFFWRTNKIIDDFAISLADGLYSQVSPEMLKITHKKRSKQWDKQVNETIQRIQEFKITQGLGLYRKARLHQEFMNRLESHGFQKQIIKELNEHILISTP